MMVGGVTGFLPYHRWLVHSPPSRRLYGGDICSLLVRAASRPQLMQLGTRSSRELSEAFCLDGTTELRVFSLNLVLAVKGADVVCTQF